MIKRRFLSVMAILAAASNCWCGERQWSEAVVPGKNVFQLE